MTEKWNLVFHIISFLSYFECVGIQQNDVGFSLGGYPTTYNGFPPQRDKLNPIRIDVADNALCVSGFY